MTESEWTVILSVFKKHPEIGKVILFGSRAKGTAKANSDIDLAVEGSGTDLEMEALALELDELPLPYKFDVKALPAIRNAALADHITRVGIIVYP